MIERWRCTVCLLLKCVTVGYAGAFVDSAACPATFARVATNVEDADGVDDVAFLQMPPADQETLRSRARRSVELVQQASRSHLSPATLVSEAALSNLWGGMDLTEDEFSEIDAYIKAFHNSTRVRKLAERSVGGTEGAHDAHAVYVLGAFDSGTNLVEATLALNWPEKISSLKKDNLQSRMDLLTAAIWKHSLSDAEEIQSHLAKDRDLANISLIIAVRSPLLHMVSWTKAPYDLKQCFGPGLKTADHWIDPCLAKLAPDCHAPFNRPCAASRFTSGVDVYNTYMGQYFQLVANNAFKHIVMIPYEDMVYSPREVMRNVAKTIGWAVPNGGIEIMEKPAKNHGRPHGREEALDKLIHRTALQELTTAQRVKVCDALNGSQLLELLEGGLTEHPRSYIADCIVPLWGNSTE